MTNEEKLKILTVIARLDHKHPRTYFCDNEDLKTILEVGNDYVPACEACTKYYADINSKYYQQRNRGVFKIVMDFRKENNEDNSRP